MINHTHRGRRRALRSSDNRRRTLLPTLAAAATAVAVLAGCVPAAPPELGQQSAAAALEHAHGLAYDPEGDALLVASHYGLYRLKPGAEQPSVSGPVGQHQMDLMGFTFLHGVAYASGHPGDERAASLGTPNLGLIRSDDKGAEWENVSLAGDVDFHSIAVSEANPSQLYGLDSATGEVFRSEDAGTTWQIGATVAAAQIHASPIEADVLFATTEDGLAVSSDGGATFEVDSFAPVLQLVTDNGSRDGRLIGLAPDGVIWWQNSDGVWESGGSTAGAPQALLVAPGSNRLVVVDDRGIVATEDQGKTWSTLWATS